MAAALTAFLATQIIGTVTIGGLLGSFAFNYIVQAVFAKKPSANLDFSQIARDNLLTVRQPVAPTDVVLGEVRKGGVLVFMHTTSRSEDELAVQSESSVVPEESPYTITVEENGNQPHRDAVGVIARVWNPTEELYDTVTLIEAASSPAAGEFSVDDATGTYTFNAAQAGAAVVISYRYVAQTTVSKWLHLVVELAGHQVQEIGDLYFDNDIVFLGADGWATGKYANHVYVGKHLGTEDQAADDMLMQRAPDKWTSEHRGRGIAYAHVMLLKNPDLFPNGIPNITFMVKGLQAWDPRTAATAWTPNVPLLLSAYLTDTRFGLKHVYADEIDDTLLTAAANIADEEVLLNSALDTTTFTVASATDDAIHLANLSRLLQTGDGVRVASSTTLPAGLSAATTYYARRINAADGGPRWTLHTSLAGAYANTGKVNITDAGSGTHTLTYYAEARYTANGIFKTSELPKDILGRLKAAMIGHCVRIGGKWRARAGAYITPTLSLDEDAARGPGGFSVESRISRREGFNGVKGVYSSPDNAWQPADFPSVQVAAYVTEDNDEESWLDLDLPFTTSGARAQRIGKALIEQARRQITVTYPMKLTAYQAEPPETIQLSDDTMGWSGKVFEISGGTLRLDEDGEGAPVLGVDLVLRETDSLVWAWDPDNEERPRARAPATRLPNPFEVAPPGKPAVTETMYETRRGRGVAVKANVSWAASPDGQARSYDVQWKLVGATGWKTHPGIPGLADEVLDIAPGRYHFRVRARSGIGVASAWAQTTREIRGLGDRPATPTIVGAQPRGNGLLMTLAPAAELDVTIGGKWLVRHDPDTVSPAWETSTSIGSPQGYPGANTLLELPLKVGTYLVKAQDSSGLTSATAAEFYVTQDSVLEYSTTATYDLFNGSDSATASNALFIDSMVKLTGAGMFDDIPDVDSVESIDSYGGVAPSGSFQAGLNIALMVGTRARLTANIEAVTVNVNDNFDNRTADMDDWLDFDGTAGGGAGDAWIEINRSSEGWQRLDSAEFVGGAYAGRIQLRSDDPAYNIHVTTAEVVFEVLA